MAFSQLVGYQGSLCIVLLFAFYVCDEDMGTFVGGHNVDFAMGVQPTLEPMCFIVYLRIHGKQHRTSTRGRCLPTVGQVNRSWMVAL